MSKEVVCDICKAEGKYSEAFYKSTVRGKPLLSLDYCEKCKEKLPKTMADYVRFVYKTVHHTTLKDEDVKTLVGSIIKRR